MTPRARPGERRDRSARTLVAGDFEDAVVGVALVVAAFLAGAYALTAALVVAVLSLVPPKVA